MNKEDVVTLMCEVINEMNRQMAFQSGIPSDQADAVIKEQQSELRRVNGLIYDKLVSAAIIK